MLSLLLFTVLVPSLVQAESTPVFATLSGPGLVAINEKHQYQVAAIGGPGDLHPYHWQIAGVERIGQAHPLHHDPIGRDDGRKRQDAFLQVDEDECGAFVDGGS
jgi:hypothetical protein